MRRDRKKKTKNDATVRLAGLVHKEGREGVEAEWESSNEFHEAWKLKVRIMPTQTPTTGSSTSARR